MSEAQSGGARLAFDRLGPGGRPVVLFAHALGTSGALWEPQRPALAPHVDVLTYDARGHGRSSVPEGPYSLDMLVDDAIAVLDAAGVARAHVCGLSIGGLTAMGLALRAPERVDRVVLANTAARIGTPDSWAQRVALVATEGLAPVAATVRGRWLSEDFADRQPDTLRRIVDMLLATHTKGYLGACAALAGADLSRDVPRITAPTLVIAGTQDPATTVEDGRWLSEAIPSARLVCLDAAHLSNVEQAAAFSETLLGFLQGTHHG